MVPRAGRRAIGGVSEPRCGELRRLSVKCPVSSLAWPSGSLARPRCGYTAGPDAGPSRCAAPARIAESNRGGRMSRTNRAVIAPEALDRLIGALRSRGFRVLGPTVRDGAIVYDELDVGRRAPGRLDRRAGRRHLPARAARRRGALRLRRRPALVEALPLPAARAALARAPDGDGALAVDGGAARRDAARVHRRALLRAARDRDPGPGVPRRRATSTATTRRGATGAFIVAVNCGEPGGTCFCVSMGTGPEVEAGLRPRADRAPRRRAPLPRRGRAASAAPRCSPSCRARRGRRGRPRRRRARRSSARRGRWAGTMDTDDLRDLLQRNLEHPRWDDVADRCLTCGNCTMVCPTCFCTTVEDVTDLAGDEARARARLGLLLHASTTPTSTAAASGSSARSRYRQWMTHKLGDLERPVRHLGLRRLRALHHLVPGRHRHHRGGRARSARREEAAMRSA